MTAGSECNSAHLSHGASLKNLPNLPIASDTVYKYSYQMDAMPPVTSPPLAAMPLPQARGGGVGVPARHPPPPETLHPALWLGHQLGRQPDQAVPSGFAALDAELPGGGWPRRGLSGVLLPPPGVGGNPPL